MTRLVAFGLLCSLAATPAWAADERNPLLIARQMYNQRDFDAAIVAADQARQVSGQADSADLIAARALLERYRQSGAPDDLAGARDRLRQLAPERFAPRERLEYIVGLGEALYFDDAPGAAAAVFDSVLDATGVALIDGRDTVLDWWASAVDDQARPRSEFDRHALYEQIRTRMVAELARNPGSATAAYWAAAAARGQGDVQLAWEAAQAGWVRAPLGSDRGAALRGDLDRLVNQALIPERARVLGQPPETLREEWELFKEKWSR